MSAPHHNDGPFVNDSRGPGLLRRLLGGGTNDPSSPHAHTERSTSEMHDTPLRPTARTTPVAPSSPFGIPKVTTRASTDADGGSPVSQRGAVVSILVWLIRHPRIAITVVALGLVFIGQFSDTKSELEQASDELSQIQEQFSSEDFQTQIEEGTFEGADIPQVVTPEDLSASAFRATIVKVRADDVTISAGGQQFTWKIASTGVYANLTRNVGQEALVHWDIQGTDVVVTGVEGPNGSIEPPAA